MIHKLKRLIRTHVSMCFHKLEMPRVIRATYYDCEVHYGFSIGYITIGFWRDADSLDAK